MNDVDRIEIRKFALSHARDVTAAVAGANYLDREADELTLANADRFAKWLETGVIPPSSRGQNTGN